MDTPRTARRPAALLAVALAAACLSTVPASAQAGPAVTVVVTAATGGVQAAAAAVRAAGGTVLERLPLTGGVGASLPSGTVLSPAFTVSANLPMSVSASKTGLGRTPTAIRAALRLPAAADQGTGTTVAVLDTGVADSPDLAGRLTHLDASGTWAAGEPRDGFGHGTFVAGAVAGDGASSAGRYAGVAPGADVVDIRVADDNGESDLLTVLKGLELAATLDVDVLNLSLSSGSTLPYQIDPLTVALDKLWAAGVVVVVPSGNDGPGMGSVTSPGTDPTLLTVGSLDERLTADRRDDVVTAFSGRGPAPQDVAKPDLVAPGQSLVSLRAPGSLAEQGNPDSVVAGNYFRGSGTSFSTALVSGAAAVLLQQRADLRPDQIKALLTGTAYAAKALRDAREAGAGGLDVAAALAAPRPDVADAVLDAPPPGDEAGWERFLQAVEDGDQAAATAAWDQLSPASHRWAANSWSSHRWATADADADAWQMRFWAADRWASHRWASHRWAQEDWASSRWASSRWASSRWAGAWQ